MEKPFFQKARRSMRESRAPMGAEVETLIRCRDLSKKIETQEQGWIADISEKGALFIASGKGIPPGLEVHATFHLPGLENELPVSFFGKTVRIKSLEGGRYGTGIEFTEISETSRRTIRSFIALRQLGEAL